MMSNCGAHDTQSPSPPDQGCICQSGWQRIVADHRHLLDRLYLDSTGGEYRLFGLVHGADGFRFGLYGELGLLLPACASSLGSHGFSLKNPAGAGSGAEGAPPSETAESTCICQGNWRQLVKECEGLFGRRFQDEGGREFVFFGLVDGEDDYYYGMHGVSGIALLSCVGSIAGFGFTLIP